MKSNRKETAIIAHGLVKRFGDVYAVNNLNLNIKKGTVYSILGPNGAGKTTTIRMLTTLVKPDAGTATILGYDMVRDAKKLHSHLSLTGQFASVDDDLTGYENLQLIAGLLGFRNRMAKLRASELLEAFSLNDAADRQVKSYSGGMRRRLDIAASLLAPPDLMFLDEPTSGLDPRSRLDVWSIIRTLVTKGTTVCLTTQYLEEADQLSDRIAVIDRGVVIAEGTCDELKNSFGQRIFRLKVCDFENLEKVRQILSNETIGPQNDPLELLIRSSDITHAFRMLSLLVNKKVSIIKFSFDQPSLDEIFLSLTEHGAKLSAHNQDKTSLCQK